MGNFEDKFKEIIDNLKISAEEKLKNEQSTSKQKYESYCQALEDIKKEYINEKTNE